MPRVMGEWVVTRCIRKEAAGGGGSGEHPGKDPGLQGGGVMREAAGSTGQRDRTHLPKSDSKSESGCSPWVDIC